MEKNYWRFNWLIIWPEITGKTNIWFGTGEKRIVFKRKITLIAHCIDLPWIVFAWLPLIIRYEMKMAIILVFGVSLPWLMNDSTILKITWNNSRGQLIVSSPKYYFWARVHTSCKCFVRSELYCDTIGIAARTDRIYIRRKYEPGFTLCRYTLPVMDRSTTCR